MVKHIMKGFEPLISYDEMINVFKSINFKKPGIESVTILSSISRISSETVLADNNIPLHDRSAMDGYALKSINTQGASVNNPLKLRIAGVQLPSDSVTKKAEIGECIEVYTGSKIPDGCDSVVKVEDTEREGNYVYIYVPCSLYENISRSGEDISKGSKIILKNQKITAAHISAMAALGINNINVYNKIRICIINTGEELLNKTINNSTGALLSAFYNNEYIKTDIAATCGDNIDSIRTSVKNIIKLYDIIIITGGSSLGRHDLTTEALESISELKFSGVAIRPGRTMALFLYSGKPVISVSGLPVAALLSSMILVNEYIKKLFNLEIYKKDYAILERNIHNKPGFSTFQIALTEARKDGLHAIPMNTRVSGNISSIIEGNSIIFINENLEGLEEGKLITVYLIGDVRWD